MPAQAAKDNLEAHVQPKPEKVLDTFDKDMPIHHGWPLLEHGFRCEVRSRFTQVACRQSSMLQVMQGLTLTILSLQKKLLAVSSALLTQELYAARQRVSQGR